MKTALKGIEKNISDTDLMDMTDLTNETFAKLKILYKKYGTEAANHLHEVELPKKTTT